MMYRSPYAVTPALTVACPPRPEGCGATIGEWCVRPIIGPSGITGYERRLRCHSARRRLADEQRTREVNPDLDPPSYLPVREPLPPRIPDLCPDDVRDEPHNPETCRDPACECMPF